MKRTQNSLYSRNYTGSTVGVGVAMLLLGGAAPRAYADSGIVTEDLYAQHCVTKTACSPSASPLSANDLVQSLIGDGITATHVTATGSTRAFGRFVTSQVSTFGFGSGVVISTGCVSNIIGPNESEQTTCDNGMPGDPALSALSGGQTFDAAILEFDFVPDSSFFGFQYAFASEEYNEFANSAFNDVFGFYLNGNDAAHEVAYLPGTNTPVSINTINGGNPYGWNAHHPELFRNNSVLSGGGNIPTEMDGMTGVLSVQASVNPGVINHIKIAIADVNDGLYDSNVIIKTGSVTSHCLQYDMGGVCMRFPAPPSNHPPVALCQNVKAPANASCGGCGDINAGSYDPDGDPMTCVASTSCPLPLGGNTLTLTCTDSHGASASCTGTVTVIDVTPPVMTTPPSLLETSNMCIGMMPVTYNVGATDNCSPVTVSCDPPAGSSVAVGTSGLVTCTAVDGAGNIASTSFKMLVTVGDGTLNSCKPTVTDLHLVADEDSPAWAAIEAAEGCGTQASYLPFKLGNCAGATDRLGNPIDLNTNGVISRIEWSGYSVSGGGKGGAAKVGGGKPVIGKDGKVKDCKDKDKDDKDCKGVVIGGGGGGTGVGVGIGTGVTSTQLQKWATASTCKPFAITSPTTANLPVGEADDPPTYYTVFYSVSDASCRTTNASCVVNLLGTNDIATLNAGGFAPNACAHCVGTGCGTCQ